MSGWLVRVRVLLSVWNVDWKGGGTVDDWEDGRIMVD